MNFGNYLKMVRINSDHSQKSLCLATGIATTLISRYENNRLNPRLDTLKKISEATGVSLVALLKEQSRYVSKKKEAVGLNISVPIIAQPYDVYFEHDELVINRVLLRHISFPTELLPTEVAHQSLAGYFIKDISLDKVFHKDSFMLIDTLELECGNGRFMAVLLNNKIEVKFVSMQGPSTFVLSAADKKNLIPPIIVHRDQMQVIGAVICHSERLA